MTIETLTDRVIRLEEQMRAIIERESTKQPTSFTKDWRKTVGMFRNDPIMGQIIEAGERVREEDRRQAQS